VLKELKANCSFENYGIVKSDLSTFGALKTKSYKQLEKNIQENDNIVIGGGEVLFANWTVLYSFINKYFAQLIKKPFFKKIENKFLISIKILSKSHTLYPYCFHPNDFNVKSLNIYYSSVGGGSYNKNSILKKNLEAAKVLSVRDKRTLLNLTKNDELIVKLVPDSALLMSRYYNITFLNKINSRIIGKSYIFVQLGKKKGPENIHLFGQHLKNIAKHLKKNVILCPIGLAAGHEDHKILKALNLEFPEFLYFEPKNIFEIMELIAKSDIYIGTSLHGAITAMSFLKPAIGLNSDIIKLENYLQTWISEDYKNLSYNELNYKNVINLLNIFYERYNKAKLLKQQQEILSNIKNIIYS
jgi:polysaccharide pyruvyl transferase WcaK-like protein